MAVSIQEAQRQRNRQQDAANHAAAELSTRGTWTCDCSCCKEARELSNAVMTIGRCLWCDSPLKGRKSKKYCCTNHRIRAFQLRERKKPDRAGLPLFEPEIAGRTGS